MLLLLLSLPLLACGSESLREAGGKRGLYMGAASNHFHLDSDPTYRTVLAAQYSLVTPENACKWSATEPQRGVFNFTACDTVFNASRAAGQRFRGHNLCWGVHNPEWLEKGTFTPSEKRSILTNHISTVAARYTSSLAWDVVNEAVSDRPTAGNGSLKHNVWYPDVTDYIDLAFHTARQAAGPEVQLFYNDYNIAEGGAKTDAVYALLKGMKDRGTPIDGVGFQLHVSVDFDRFSDVQKTMARMAGLGLVVHVTELDVTCGTPCNVGKQAIVYSSLLRACLQTPACRNFETWGFTDKYTWRGEGAHPLPFNATFHPKPAVAAMLNVLASN